MEAERIGEGDLEEAVVGRRGPLHRIGESVALPAVEFVESGDGPQGHEHDLKGPDSPPWNQRNPFAVAEDDTCVLPDLFGRIVGEQRAPVPREVLLLRGVFPGDFVGNHRTGPDLAMRWGELQPIISPRFSKIST